MRLGDGLNTGPRSPAPAPAPSPPHLPGHSLSLPPHSPTGVASGIGGGGVMSCLPDPSPGRPGSPGTSASQGPTLWGQLCSSQPSARHLATCALVSHLQDGQGTKLPGLLQGYSTRNRVTCTLSLSSERPSPKGGDTGPGRKAARPHGAHRWVPKPPSHPQLAASHRST